LIEDVHFADERFVTVLEGFSAEAAGFIQEAGVDLAEFVLDGGFALGEEAFLASDDALVGFAVARGVGVDDGVDGCLGEFGVGVGEADEDELAGVADDFDPAFQGGDAFFILGPIEPRERGVDRGLLEDGAIGDGVGFLIDEGVEVVEGLVLVGLVDEARAGGCEEDLADGAVLGLHGEVAADESERGERAAEEAGLAVAAAQEAMDEVQRVDGGNAEGGLVVEGCVRGFVGTHC